jgi:hypothetical protein
VIAGGKTAHEKVVPDPWISSFGYYWNGQSRNNIAVILLTNGAKNWIIGPDQINTEIANIIFSNM